MTLLKRLTFPFSLLKNSKRSLNCQQTIYCFCRFRVRRRRITKDRKVEIKYRFRGSGYAIKLPRNAYIVQIA